MGGGYDCDTIWVMSEKVAQDFGGQILLQEYLRLCAEIRSIESSNEKIIGLGFTLIGLAATAGIAQEVAPLFFVLPVAMIGILAYAAVSYLCIFSMGGYKRHLENLLNVRAKERLLLWEQLVPERERLNWNGRLLWLIYFLVAASIFVVSVLQLSAEYGPWVGRVMAIGIVALLIIFLWGVRQMLKAFERAYARAKQLHDAD